jgi:flagellar basal-body rod modification protein FlgD
MDNKEFISQMAQFSSLEQMNNMNSGMNDFLKFQKISQAGSLVGKKVEILDSNTGQNITGMIEKANVTGETATVTVNGEQHSISNIQEILAKG